MAQDVPAFSTLAAMLAHHARLRPQSRALLFLSDRGEAQDSLTYGDLLARAQFLARHLAGQTQRGDRVILLLHTGPDFAVALFACALAGLIAVPIMPPRRLATRDFSDAILADCAPRLVLTNQATAQGAAQRLRQDGMAWLYLDALDEAGPQADPVAATADDLAVLQYTSGSTSAPKGVMVSQRNLIANLDAIRHFMGSTPESVFVSWGPLYHDLGLVMDLLQPLYAGGLCVLMRPAAFMQRPLSWLTAIHRYGAVIAGAPNFAYELCAERFRPEQMEGVDLSGWKVAFNGAEPVRAATLARFSETFAPYGFDARAHFPGYGLAEATLMVTAARRGRGAVLHTISADALLVNRVAPPRDDMDARVLVACGEPVPDTDIAIVDPETAMRLPPLRVGEIWIAGPGVARGYWNNPAATQETFRARIAGEEPAWLRTGDLGYLDADGALVITGRSKDVLIVRGMNHYPQDVEATVARAHPALAPDGGAVFIAPGGQRIIVVQEVERSRRRDLAHDEIVDAVREAVARNHELSVKEVVLIAPGALPKTTSGKVQRQRTAQLWRDGGLAALQP